MFGEACDHVIIVVSDDDAKKAAAHFADVVHFQRSKVRAFAQLQSPHFFLNRIGRYSPF